MSDDAPTPPPARKTALSLVEAVAVAVPLSLGVALIVPSFAVAVSGVLLVAFTPPNKLPDDFVRIWLQGAAILMLGLVPGLGLLWRRAWARPAAIAAALGWVAMVFVREHGRAALREPGSTGLAVVLPAFVALHSLLLLAGPVKRAAAATDEQVPGRAATIGYTSAVFWLIVLVWFLQSFVLGLKPIFESMNIELPPITQLLLGAADVLESSWFIFYPFFYAAVILGPVPILGLDEARARRMPLVVNVAGALGLTIMVLSTVVPILKLQASLRQ